MIWKQIHLANHLELGAYTQCQLMCEHFVIFFFSIRSRFEWKLFAIYFSQQPDTSAIFHRFIFGFWPLAIELKCISYPFNVFINNLNIMQMHSMFCIQCCLTLCQRNIIYIIIFRQTSAEFSWLHNAIKLTRSV